MIRKTLFLSAYKYKEQTNAVWNSQLHIIKKKKKKSVCVLVWRQKNSALPAERTVLL